MGARPPLSIVLAVRERTAELDAVLDALLPQARSVGAETLVVGAVDLPATDSVRLLPVDDADIYRLRAIGVREARGEIVAIGEDHAVPRPDWCEAILRAHAEHPDAAAVVGCLVNATDGTLSGRANFMAFAAPYAPPMPRVPAGRPPPLSTLSLKRAALGELDGRLGDFEARLVPRLFREGRMAADERIVVDHQQDHGMAWSIINGFHGARGSYGYLRADDDWRTRLRDARWALSHWPRILLGEARETVGQRRGARWELTFVAAIGAAVGLGGALGSLLGPGRSPRRVA
jgi:hypothetical protein